MAGRRYSLVFYAALIVALVATYGVWRVIETTKQSNRIATTPVVVAAKDIPEGTLIDRLSLSVMEWPASTVPAGAFGRVDSVAGRVTRVNVFQGEPFVPGRLAPEGTSAGLITKIPQGRRAMSVRINDVSGLAGQVQPDSRVDILLTLNNASEGSSAKLFMENMRVLSIGTQTQTAADGRPIVATVATLDVSPQESERLGVALTQGSMQLILRGYGDPEIVNTKGASARDVIASLREYQPPANPPRTSRPPQRKAEPAAAAPAPVIQPPFQPPTRPVTEKPESLTVQIFKGSTKSEAKFKKDSVRRDTTKY
jgi:pilus assembly protein CpaB